MRGGEARKGQEERRVRRREGRGNRKGKGSGGLRRGRKRQ